MGKRGSRKRAKKMIFNSSRRIERNRARREEERREWLIDWRADAETELEKNREYYYAEADKLAPEEVEALNIFTIRCCELPVEIHDGFAGERDRNSLYLASLSVDLQLRDVVGGMDMTVAERIGIIDEIDDTPMTFYFPLEGHWT